MKKIIKFFIDNYKLTWILTFITVLAGIAGFSLILRERTPTVDLGTVKINTFYYGATAEEIESEITKKIEDELRGIKGLKDVKSVSQSNQSMITIRIDIDNYDQDDVTDDIQTAVDRVTDLPANIDDLPEVIEINTEEFAVMKLAILGNNDNRQRDAFAEYLVDEIEDVNGVLEVEETGYAEREFSVMLNAPKMEELYVGVSEVVDALSKRNVNFPAGSLKSHENQGIVRLDSKALNAKELENTLIRSNFNGQKIYLKDIATVLDGKKELDVITTYNGQDATFLEVKKKGGYDSIRLVEQINKKIDDAEKRYGNKFEVVRYYDEAIKVQQKFDVIKSNVISGVLIVLFFMLIFLPGKVGIMATMSMPFCFLVMLGLMPSLGINLHSISMLAMVIALGMLVDNSIVISENFVRLRKEGFTSKEAALESTYQVWLPVTATALTTIFAFLPMLLTKGVIGKFITSIPIIVSLTLAISILEALFLLPTRLVAVSGSVLKKKSANKARESNTDWFDKVADKFEKLTLYFIRHRYFTLVLFIICIVLSGIFISMNKFILFPAEHVERYQVTYYGKLGDSLEKMNENSIRLANDIMNTLGDDVKYITAFTGRSGNLNLTDTLQQNNHSAEMIIEVTYDASRRLNHYEVLEKLRNMDTSYLEKVSFVTESAGPPSGKAVEVSFRGNEFEDIYKAINAVKEKASKVDGIIDIEYDDYQNDDEIAIKPDYEVLARLGLTSTDVGNTIRASLEGIPITSITLNNREFDIKVRYADEYKQTEEDIKNLTIRDAKGNLIPLYKVAKVERKEGPRMINRYNFKRSITFKANVDETKITAIEANNLIQKFFNEIKDDNPNVNIVFTGEKESTDESFESLAIAMQFALVAIFAILVFMTNSYAKPLLIMTSIPLGLLGFAVAFYLHAKPVSFLAMIGIVGLAGIVVNVGIVLISFIDEMRKHSTMPLEEILAKSSRMRLRAVTVSTLTTICGLLPTAYGIGGTDDDLVPMTLAMAWGLTSGTIVSLIWIPAAYAIIEDFDKMIRKTKVGMYFYKKRLKAKRTKINERSYTK